MNDSAFSDLVAGLCRRDGRYAGEAYFFLREALDAATKNQRRSARTRGRSISGQELLDFIRTHALREFGPMTRTVFRTWGLNRTEDFGEIVFQLVEAGFLGKTDEDRREDFAGGFDFDEAFVKPFVPGKAPGDSKGGGS
jgi:uncharacterized repeat protein (TIGR04138 family)